MSDRVDDPINHPAHYTSSPAKCGNCGTTIECIDVVQWMSFCLGNAVKYVWRHGLKSEDPIQDLMKARWYIDRELQKLSKGRGVEQS